MDRPNQAIMFCCRWSVGPWTLGILDVVFCVILVSGVHVPFCEYCFMKFYLLFVPEIRIIINTS